MVDCLFDDCRRSIGLMMLLLLLVLAGWHASARASEMHIVGGNVDRGKEAIQRYGCIACHAIPGIAGPVSNVGPPLQHVANRAYIGGVLPNVPAEMVRWLMNPPGVDPRTAMPDLGITESEAKDIASYLYTLD